MPQRRKPDPVKHCIVCGTLLVRKRFPSKLEDRTRFLSRVTCGQACGNSRKVVGKAALHQRARRYRGPRCEECGTAEGLHVHHVDRDPSNNEASNLRTLCGSCHLKLHWREDRESRVAAIRRGVARKKALA